MLTSETPQVNTRTCNRHKDTPLEMLGEVLGVPFYSCPKCVEEDEQREREQTAREKRARILASIPPLYQSATLDQFDANLFLRKAKRMTDDDVMIPDGAHAALMQWVSNPQGVLFLYGDCGVGKTHLACAIKRRLNGMNVPSRLIFANEMFLDIRGTFGNKTKDREKDIMRTYLPDDNNTVVIIDDLGVQKSSETVVESWTAIIDRLYRQNNPLMVSTNYTLAELSESLSDRIASRLASGIIIKLDGKDRRIKEHWTACYD